MPQPCMLEEQKLFLGFADFEKSTSNPNLILPDLETPVASFPIREDESAVIVGEDGRVGRPGGLAVQVQDAGLGPAAQIGR